MRKLDKLLLKAKRNRSDNLQVGICFVNMRGDKWEAHVPLWNRNSPEHDQELILTTDTLDAALAEIKKLEAVHPPWGGLESVIFIDDITKY